MGSSEVSSDHTDFGDEKYDNGPYTLNDATVTTNENIPNWTSNFTDITTEPFTQDSGPSLPKNLRFSVSNALDYYNLLFKPEIFNGIRDHTNNYVILKQDEIWRNRNNLDYVDNMWQDTNVNPQASKQINGSLLFYIIVLKRVNVFINKGL